VGFVSSILSLSLEKDHGKTQGNTGKQLVLVLGTIQIQGSSLVVFVFVFVFRKVLA
jgi:hypothetical protein